MVLAVARMRLASRRGDLPVAAGQAQPLLAPPGAADPARLGLGEDLRALALIDLGIAELWTARSAGERPPVGGSGVATRSDRPRRAR